VGAAATTEVCSGALWWDGERNPTRGARDCSQSGGAAVPTWPYHVTDHGSRPDSGREPACVHRHDLDRPHAINELKKKGDGNDFLALSSAISRAGFLPNALLPLSSPGLADHDLARRLQWSTCGLLSFFALGS